MTECLILSHPSTVRSNRSFGSLQMTECLILSHPSTVRSNRSFGSLQMTQSALYCHILVQYVLTDHLGHYR